ncbi:hypothetical protein [Microbacterium sp. che218]|uniref:hypothetical protein n=1 Tax=Microbacterium sp. che218 TaxID=3140649 RepID=UPI00336BF23F
MTAYMLRADVVAFDSGGLFDAWVASEQQVVGTPHVVVAQPTFPVAVPARDVTEFCGLVSEWATLLLPVVEWAIKHVELEGLSLELASWADSHGVSPNGVSFIVRVASLLAQALVRLEVGESGS